MSKKNVFDKEVSFLFKLKAGKPIGGATIATKVAPLGVAPKKLGTDIAAKIKQYNGIKVIVKVVVQNRQYTIEVVPTSALLIKSEVAKKGKVGIVELKSIAQSLGKKLRGNTEMSKVLQLVGTCGSLGISVDGLTSKEAIKRIRTGETTV